MTNSIIKIGDNEFKKLSQFIHSQYGIKLPEVKRPLLQGRLQKRLKENSCQSFKEYCDLVFSDKGEQTEIIHMIDMISTNKTDFFREKNHFNFISSELLPGFRSQNLKVWSAACSSGEEVYTMAMVLNEYLSSKPQFSYSILGTDISLQMLQKSVAAVYSYDRISGIPLHLKMKYFLKKKNQSVPDVRIVRSLRKNVKFKRLNLMDTTYQVDRDFDIIFCRNVLIYFEKENQISVINKLLRHLKPGGFFFLGHSESIMGIDLPLRQIKPTIYQKIAT